MERRVLLAIALSFIVLFAYQALLPPSPPQNGNVTAPPDAAVTAPNAAGTSAAAAPSATPAPNPQTPPPSVEATVGDTEERQIVVETPEVRAVFTNRGARLRHWVLKDFDRNDAGEPIDLIPETIPPEWPLPFSLRVDDAATTASLNQGLYRVSGPTDGTVTFEFETADGLKARKVFALKPQNFIVEFSALVEKDGQPLNPTIEWGPGLTDEIARSQKGSFLSPSYVYHAQAIYDPQDDDVVREQATKLEGGVVHEGAYQWAGVDDHYFISAVLHPPAPIRLEYHPVTIPAPTTPPVNGQYVAWSVRFPSAPEAVQFYVGPKKLDVMRAIDPEFTRAIYFGMFAWLAAPLLDALRWVHGYIGSWGWSIIVLTVLINLAMFPLRHKSVVSMRKMQEIQPQMKAIQDRYAKYKVTDPERQKMNQEVMELYRSRGVNPASGCVPTLITLPFLFAFYAMLGQAIELRGESFWWVPDLALRDPLFILPAAMGLTMFWQQRITPTTADPTQQKIMMFMPIMITVTMLFAPAGLVIYWFVSQLWGIGQQYFTNWRMGPTRPGANRPAREPKPAPRDIVVAPSRGKK